MAIAIVISISQPHKYLYLYISLIYNNNSIFFSLLTLPLTQWMRPFGDHVCTFFSLAALGRSLSHSTLFNSISPGKNGIDVDVHDDDDDGKLENKKVS